MKAECFESNDRHAQELPWICSSCYLIFRQFAMILLLKALQNKLILDEAAWASFSLLFCLSNAPLALFSTPKRLIAFATHAPCLENVPRLRRFFWNKPNTCHEFPLISLLVLTSTRALCWMKKLTRNTCYRASQVLILEWNAREALLRLKFCL